MSDKISIAHELQGQGLEQQHLFTINFNDSALLNHDAKFQVQAKVRVHDSRGVDSNAVVYEHQFRVTDSSYVVRIPLSDIPCYDYSGRMISVDVVARCVIDDGIIFDTKAEQVISIDYQPLDDGSSDTASLVDPKDSYGFFTNYKIIPFRNKLWINLALVLAIPLVLLNLVFGMHDQFSSGKNVVFGGDEPLLWSGVTGGLSGLGIWAFIRYQLKSYMTFSMKKLHQLIDQGTRLSIGDLVKGKSRVVLKDVTLRVVACNIEKGQYVRGHGTKQRTVSFSEPCRGVTLYEKQVTDIPARMQVALFFSGQCEFRKMFETLYPALEVSSTHGLEVYWEVQLLHPQFVDQELKGPANMIDRMAFYRALGEAGSVHDADQNKSRRDHVLNRDDDNFGTL